jgi:hypothetical protein
MNMVSGGLPDEPGLDDSFQDGGDGCEGCDGSGVRCPAEPSCAIPELPPGWVVVERCDYCERYPNDLAAAEVVCTDAKWVRCESDGFHAVGFLSLREGS